MTATKLVWRVRPASLPKVLRHCPRCELKREYVSTDKFRINGHQSRIDVWLIYQCRVCKFTWKLTLFTRVLPSSIDPDLFDKFTRNDAATAHRYACDESLIRRAGGQLEGAVRYGIEGDDLDVSHGGTATIFFDLEAPIEVRLEAAIAKKLGISRAQVESMIERGTIAAVGRKMPKKLAHGLELRVDLADLGAVLAAKKEHEEP
jgi:hypothetical protein